jgi:hydroxymethylbilane synthase
MRRDLDIVPLRGNVDTRLRKLEAGDFEAIILASAGVTRLGFTNAVREYLSSEQMCPAAGQGALAIQTRATDRQTTAAVQFLNDAPTRAAVDCERAALNVLGGGCQVPIGAYAEGQQDGLLLRAVVASPDGSEIVREQRSGSSPQELGMEVGQALLARGARRILDAVYGREAFIPQQP